MIIKGTIIKQFNFFFQTSVDTLLYYRDNILYLIPRRDDGIKTFWRHKITTTRGRIITLVQQ